MVSGGLESRVYPFAGGCIRKKKPVVKYFVFTLQSIGFRSGIGVTTRRVERVYVFVHPTLCPRMAGSIRVPIVLRYAMKIALPCHSYTPRIPAYSLAARRVKALSR